MLDVLPSNSLDKGVDTSFNAGNVMSLKEISGNRRTMEAHMESSVWSALNFRVILAKSKGLIFIVSASKSSFVFGVADYGDASGDSSVFWMKNLS